MRHHLPSLSTLSALSLFWATSALADSPGISPQEKAAVIMSLSATLKANYVFPDIARKIEPALQDHLARGDYDAATTKDQLARKLTGILLGSPEFQQQ